MVYPTISRTIYIMRRDATFPPSESHMIPNEQMKKIVQLRPILRSLKNSP